MAMKGGRNAKNKNGYKKNEIKNNEKACNYDNDI